MKSYKQRTLEAQLMLIKAYEEKKPLSECPLCIIYRNKKDPFDCTGCFQYDDNMSDSDSWILCQETDSFISSDNKYNFLDRKKINKRILYHKKMRKILLKRPARLFTPKGWKRMNINKNW